MKTMTILLALILFSCNKTFVEPTQCYECFISIQVNGYPEKQIWTRIVRTPEGMREFERKGTITDSLSQMVTTCYKREK